MKSVAQVVALVLLAAVAAASERFATRQPAARFYMDLGAEAIDVSSYPDEQQKNYLAFQQICSRCHTLARPINAAITSEADWRRFITRMRHKSLLAKDKNFGPEQARAILSFLVFDSKARKLAHPEAFAAQTAQLKQRFERLSKERAARGKRGDQQRVKPYGDDTMPRPQPQ